MTQTSHICILPWGWRKSRFCEKLALAHLHFMKNFKGNTGICGLSTSLLSIV